jgi:hypothetical protein
MKAVEAVKGVCHGQADHVKKKHEYSIVTENTKYALRLAYPGAADRPARGWAPKERIVMIPKRPHYYPFNVCLIMAATETWM